MTAIVDSQPALVNATRFRAAHEAEWERLDRIVSRIEKRSVKALDDDDLLALPLLYRSTLSSLSVARETSLDRALITYLEQLCTRAYFQIYGVPTSAWSQIKHFFAHSWPAAMQSLWRETWVAVAITALAAVVGYLLVSSDPTWFYAFMPEEMAGGRTPTASVTTLRDTIYKGDQNMLTTFATYLFTHNAQIAIFAFALGFAFAAPTVLLIAYNGLMLGAFVAIFVPKGLGIGIGGWLFIHGTTELFAICVSGGAGIRIGMAIAFPGRQSRLDSAVTAGRTAATAMGGAVVMLALAGLLEGIGRQTVTGDVPRYLVGSVMLIGWLVYFYAPRRSWQVRNG